MRILIFTRRALMAAALALPVACRMPWSGGGDVACAETAHLDYPVDLSAFAAGGTVWPHGVHGGAHPEGHPGIDFILAEASGDIAVTAPLTAQITAVQADSLVAGNSCIVLDSACVQINFCHLRLEAGLGAGDRVKRGQRIGTVGRAETAGPLSLHFGAYMGRDAEQVCPGDLLDPDTLRCRLGDSVGAIAPADCGDRSGKETLLGRSRYLEAQPRNLSVTCIDGGTQVFSLPAENRLCNPRLETADLRRMQNCLGPACAGIW